MLLESLQQKTASRRHLSSFRQLKQLYLQILKKGCSTTETPRGNRRRPLKLGYLHGQVQIYFRSINVGLYRVLIASIWCKCSKYCLDQHKNANFSGTKFNINGRKSMWIYSMYVYRFALGLIFVITYAILCYCCDSLGCYY